MTVTEIITNDPLTGDEASIIMEDGIWVIYSGGKKYSADPDAVHNALGMLNQLSTESIAATSSSKWEEFKVDDEQAIHLVLKAGTKNVGDMFIGKFDFEQIPATQPGRQPETRMTSYVRPDGEDKVYAVSGLLRSNFQGGKTPFRNRTVFVINQHLDITKVNINGPEGSMILDVSTPDWTLNGMPTDSTGTDKYLRGLARLRNSSFLDEVDVSNMNPEYSLTIEGKSFEPVVLNAYTADGTEGYYITSSANPGSVFDGSKAGLFEKIFVSSTELMPEQ
jgi:hypothetical protein